MTMCAFMALSEVIWRNDHEPDMNDMRDMQMGLQGRYAGWWEPVCPEHGKNKLLWMLAELGEVIQGVKRHPAARLQRLAPFAMVLLKKLWMC